MMENNKYLRLFPLLCFVCVFPILSLCSAGSAATLYERSLEKFQAKAEKASSEEFIFVVLGDSRDNDKIYKQSLTLAAQFNPLFILHTGDISNTGNKKELDHFFELVQAIVPDIPLFVVFDNHELHDGKYFFATEQQRTSQA